MEAVTQADLLEALREALRTHPGPDDAKTTKEWAEALGLSTKSTGPKIDRLIRDGRMERVTVQRTDRRGYTQPVAAYRLVA